MCWAFILSLFECAKQVFRRANNNKRHATRVSLEVLHTVAYDLGFQNPNACLVKLADKELKYEIIMKHTHF